MKLIKACLSLSDDDERNFIEKVLAGLDFGTDNKWSSTLLVFIFLVCEVIPLLIVLDSFMINKFELETRYKNSMIEVDREDTIDEITEDGNIPILNPSQRIQLLEEDKHQGNTQKDISKEILDKTFLSNETNINNHQSDDEFSEPLMGKHRSSVSGMHSKLGKKYYVKRANEIIINNNKEFQIQDKFEPKLAHKSEGKTHLLGILHNSTLRGENLICRVIKFGRVTSVYEKEDFFEELQITFSICDDHIVKIKGFCIYKEFVYIFYPKLTSLYDILHIQKSALTLPDRLDIAKQLAECLYAIHK